MIASVEAIFLSTFVLISQNRMQAAADKRADLDLQISLLAEHEVTKLAASSRTSPHASASRRTPTTSFTRSSRTSRLRPCSTRSKRRGRRKRGRQRGVNLSLSLSRGCRRALGATCLEWR